MTTSFIIHTCPIDENWDAVAPMEHLEIIQKLQDAMTQSSKLGFVSGIASQRGLLVSKVEETVSFINNFSQRVE